MKKTLIISSFLAMSCGFLHAEGEKKATTKKDEKKKVESKEEVLKKHAKKAKKIADEQDEMAADIQDLIQEQTDKKLRKFLEDAENLAGEATENLEDTKTGGETLAIETEIIEKIFEAAKQKQKG